ncbi:MAG: class I SAM-dependent methyltransferase [Nitrococcus sp.]|nr:class I SAM-dependent methyltransferase [Nitrococcus sp.]
MQPVKRFHWDTPEYVDASSTVLKYSVARIYVREILRETFSHYPAEARAIDWGAGEGDFTRVMLERFQHVYAVEPHAGMRAVLARRCPRAQVFEGTITSVIPPTKVEAGLISHVLYHAPDHKWGAYTIRAANQLTEDGVLVVILKDPDSGCNQMLEYFGAARFNLYESLAGVIRLHTEFNFSFTCVPGSLSTTSFEDTLKIARFMLCDRDADAFSRSPTEQEFQEYVRAHFWDQGRNTGGWHYKTVLCFVRRNAARPWGQI